MQKGFRMLMEALDDLCLDVPEAPDLLALFTARAIVDDILPPSFLIQQSTTAGDLCKAAHRAAVDSIHG